MERDFRLKLTSVLCLVSDLKSNSTQATRKTLVCKRIPGHLWPLKCSLLFSPWLLGSLHRVTQFSALEKKISCLAPLIQSLPPRLQNFLEILQYFGFSSTVCYYITAWASFRQVTCNTRFLFFYFIQEPCKDFHEKGKGSNYRYKAFQW